MSNARIKHWAISVIVAFMLLFTGVGCSSSPPNETQDPVAAASSQAENVSKQATPDVTGTLKISYIDVGQADCILIQTNDGNNMLIDAGKNADTEIVTDYLKKRNVTKFDYVVGTHPHEDHIGSLDTVIDSFNVGKVIMPKVAHTTQTYQDVLTAIKNKGLKITAPIPGAEYILGDTKFTILAPNSENYENLNDYSVVIRLTHGENSFLFTGDAEAVSENEMLEKKHVLKSDVLKVGHHGSDTSTTASFLKAVSPRYAVISVGEDNTYGHPSPAVVDRLSAAQIEIYRTDQDGTIFATSDGEKISVRKIASSPIKPNAPPTTTQETEQPAPQTTSQEVAPPTPALTPEAAPTPAPTPEPVVQPEASSSNTTVYITNTGKKYHTSGCSSLSKSKIPISLQDAKNRGYGPCARCHPPQ